MKMKKSAGDEVVGSRRESWKSRDEMRCKVDHEKKLLICNVRGNQSALPEGFHARSELKLNGVCIA